MMRIEHREEDLENHDRGLDYDLPRLLHRRGMLKLVAGVGLAGAGLIALGACAPDGDAAQATQTSDTADGEIPEETSGPFPGDGSNGANVLTRAASYAATSPRASDRVRPRPRAYHSASP
jgi:hypothetical protein